MNGQLSIFDLNPKGKPCEYRFKRYIGQKVKHQRIEQVCFIKCIEPYYTELEDASGMIFVGTPYDIWPVEEVKNEQIH